MKFIVLILSVVVFAQSASAAQFGFRFPPSVERSFDYAQVDLGDCGTPPSVEYIDVPITLPDGTVVVARIPLPKSPPPPPPASKDTFDVRLGDHLYRLSPGWGNYPECHATYYAAEVVGAECTVQLDFESNRTISVRVDDRGCSESSFGGGCQEVE